MSRFTSYALLGSGRIARHFQFYFKQSNLPVLCWSRNADPQFNSGFDLKTTVERSSHLLFAVRDSAIEELAKPWYGHDKTLVHFSGALHIAQIHAAHPLMTFGNELQALSWYHQIPFVLDEGATLGELLPGLPNSFSTLPADARPLYHALCSLAGNSSYLLWRKIGAEFKALGLARETLAPFLQQVVIAACEMSGDNFTGPVARGDWTTVCRHLQALQTHPDLLNSYNSYLRLAHPTTPPPEALYEHS